MSRVLLAFVVIYLIFVRGNIKTIIAVFAVAALTDWFDGMLARLFKWESEFGRKADIIADRFLWIGTALAFVISYGISNALSWFHGLQLLFIMTREVITAPFALISYFSGNALPNVRYIAKVTTFIQGFALPALILSVYFPVFSYVSVPLAIACGITGFISASYYLHDIKKPKNKKNVGTRRR